MLIEPHHTVKEVARIFKKSEKTVWRWLQEGVMFPNAKKLKSGGYLIPESDVLAAFETEPSLNGDTPPEKPARPSGRRVFNSGL